MKPAISVIIPAYNEENYLIKTLNSLKQQTFQDFETIVVANGCTDNTEEIVNKRSSEQLQLLKISKPNVSRARNHGASKAAGDLLVFLDADTILENEALQKINAAFTERHTVGITRVKPDDPKIKFKLFAALKNVVNNTGIYNGWVSGALICKKKDFEAVNGYDHQRVVREQKNLILKLLNRGEFICVNTYATTSMRRFQSWGLLKATSFWIKQAWCDNFGDISKSEYEKIR